MNLNPRTLLSTEPVLLLGALQQIIALVVAFGLNLSTEQVGAILAASGAVLGVLLRRRVTPV